jgi:transposase
VKKKSYLKLHIVIALSCLAILSFSITKGTRHDSPVLQRLLKEIPKGFGDFCLDSAYLSRKMCNRIVTLGRIPFIKPKKNTCRNARGSHAWKDMVSLYMDSEDEFNEHYHKRSLVESVFNVMKGVFGNNLNARKRRMQRRELMLRIICYNIGIVNLLQIKNSMEN